MNSRVAKWGYVAAVCVAVGGVLLALARVPRVVTPNNSSTSAVNVQTNGNDRRHGGAVENAQVASLPASWPTEVPVPDGQMTSTSALSVAIVMDGSYSQVTQSIRELYTARGFTSKAATPLQFENARYAVSVAVENRDHSAASNNVTIVVSPK